MDISGTAAALLTVGDEWLATYAPSSRPARRSHLGLSDLAAGRIGGHCWLPWTLAAGVNPLDCDEVFIALDAWGAELNRLVVHNRISEHTAHNRWTSARAWHRWCRTPSGLSWPCDPYQDQRFRWFWLRPRRRSQPTALSLPEIRALLAASEQVSGSPLARRRTAATIALLLATGARIGDLARADRADVTPYGSPPRLAYSAKGGRRHEMTLPSWAITPLTRYFSAREGVHGSRVGTEPLLTSIRQPGIRWRRAGTGQLRDKVGEAAQAAGLDVRVTPHSVRGSLVTLLRSAGFQDREIIELTGHASESTLSHYHYARPKSAVEWVHTQLAS